MKSEVGEAVAKGAGQKGEMPDEPGKPDGEKRGREMSSPRTSSGYQDETYCSVCTRCSRRC